LRDVLAKRTARTLPEPPPEPAVAVLPEIKLTGAAPLMSVLPAAPTTTGPKLLSMEELGQAYGFVLYRAEFPKGLKGKLHLENVRDYAITMVNQKVVGRSFVGFGPQSFDIEANEQGPVSLDILVHNLGRISVITNAASQDRARKGLGDVLLDGKSLSGEGVEWQMYSLPLATPPQMPATFSQADVTFYHGTFGVEKPVSTFLDMRNFHMGVVWVNGHNLGRYWERGGLRSLFLSEHFLKAGENEVVVMELQGPPKALSIGSSTKIIEEPAVPFAMKLDQRVPAPAGQPGRGRGSQ
jgi:beta-galactosidase